MTQYDPPLPGDGAYYPRIRFPSWFVAPAQVRDTLTELGQRRYVELDGDRVAAPVEGAFFTAIGLLMADTDAQSAHRRLVRMGLILAYAARWPLRGTPERGATCEALRLAVGLWLETGAPVSGPVGEALFPMVHTGNQELNEALSVHRALSTMPARISGAATSLLDILDLTLDGYAIRPGDDGGRDIFHWWLCEAVPAALMGRLPDHIWNGFWPWPPRPSEDQSPSMKNT